MNSMDHSGMADAYDANPPPSRTSRAVKKNWTQIVQRFVDDGVNLDDALQWARAYAATSGIRAPSRDTLRDWMLEAKKQKGLVRAYGKSKGTGIISGRSPNQIVATPVAPPRGIESPNVVAPTYLKWPTVILVCNAKGGARTSHTMALAYHAMIEAGVKPNVTAIGGYPILRHMTRGIDCHELEGDLSDSCASYISSFLSTHRTGPGPILIDVHGWSNTSVGIQIIEALRGNFRIVMIVPTLADEMTVVGASTCLRLHPDSWIHMRYNASTVQERECRILALVAPPVAEVDVPELSSDAANGLHRIPPLSDLAAYMANIDQRGVSWYNPFLAYWNTIRGPLTDALKLACPEIFTAEQASANPEITDG